MDTTDEIMQNDGEDPVFTLVVSVENLTVDKEKAMEDAIDAKEREESDAQAAIQGVPYQMAVRATYTLNYLWKKYRGIIHSMSPRLFQPVATVHIGVTEYIPEVPATIMQDGHLVHIIQDVGPMARAC